MIHRKPIQLTGDPDRDVEILVDRIGARHHAETGEMCRMLAFIPSPEAQSWLLLLTEDPVQYTRASAVRALVYLLDAKPSPVPVPAPEPEWAARIVACLERALGDERPLVVEAALDVVGWARMRECGPAVRSLARAPVQPSGRTRAETVSMALRTLASIPGPEDIEVGIARLDDEDASIRRAAVYLLSEIVDAASIDRCAAALEGAYGSELLAGLCSTLRHRRDEAALARLAQHRSESVQHAAREALQDVVEERVPIHVPAERRLRPDQIEPHGNDGWEGSEYRVSDDDRLNRRLTGLLNEACHVFHAHAEGTWRTMGKDAYAGQLAKELRVNPWLIKVLFAFQDRVVTSLVYRALELRDEDAGTARRVEDQPIG